MTPCEWHLLQEGHVVRERQRNRQIASWLSPLISATAGKVITAAQLLGEEVADESSDSPRALAAAERKLNAKLRAIDKRNKKKIAKGGV
jgi:hypothetical protein